ncbi:PAXNEB-domain-containing protein [Suhomyces tanzawaensis NRRL Y-17324]|uniref:Elongator complex protein 4 n=1 Tax=Suhomyces tanzawaensis NRRL Y-17324 TaxID=984487 RepID=A0A1E4SER9_9ASCO|nr:PAXNEB-domain-containing protein [Suhomyces tanzawaensis NRRL Y-17324]ODV78007.1 PAXNEB-domain-containing protein [Suhomyces tanzawaensis NRRL Y-17324]
MSFRKRSEVIGGPPGVSPRTPAGVSRPLRPAVPGRGPIAPGTVPSRAPASPAGHVPPQPPSARRAQPPEIKNPAIRPSLITSQPTISTGGADLDKILLHQGLPLGHSLLIEESGSTDFASVILRAFASQAIIHNRIDKDQLHAHVVVIGVNPQWSNDLPGLYKGSSKEQKKAKIAANESKISVSNLANQSTRENDMKIAWRYGLKQKVEADAANDTDYTHQFDITQKLVPGPAATDISYIQLTPDYHTIIERLEAIVQKYESKVCRIVIPGLLNPSLYPPQCSSPNFIIPFVHSLRAVLRQHPNTALISSLPLDLYPRDSTVTGVLESLFDGVLYLQPFNQEMSQLIEKAYKNEPSKIQQGLVNIIKLPVLSEKGLMMIRDGEYAFKNGRKKFEIEEWGIPVEDEGEEKSTTKDIEF